MTVQVDSPYISIDASNNVTVSLRVKTGSGTVAANPLIVACRDSSGGNHDFPARFTGSITTAGVQLTSVQNLAAGTYYAFGAYEVGGVWTDLDSVYFTVPALGGGGAGTRLGKSSVFYDDFTGTSLVAANWTVDSTSSYPGNGPDNPADHKVDYFHTGSIAVSGSSAVFTAQSGGFDITGFPQGGSETAWYTGFLTTEGSANGFQVETGDYLEGRFLLPGAAGAWPALWTWRNGDNEVDVFEYHPDNPNLLELTNHVGAGGSDYYTNAAAVAPGTWVTVGALLGQTSVAWYVNGVQVYADSSGVGAGWTSYINLNLSLSDGFYHPQPSGSAFTFSADYVGVWR